MNSIYVGNNRLLTQLNTGQFMYLSGLDQTVTPCIAFHFMWESGCTKAFLGLLKPDSIVFDLGANFGYYSVIALSKVKRGELYAFEPQPKVYDMLVDTMYLNRAGLTTKVKVENKAVSDKDGSITFYPHDKFTANASIYSSKKQGIYASEPLEVETVTIDSYLKDNNIPRIDVMKVDTEGNEPLVYAGMKETIKNCNIKLVLEFCAVMYEDADAFFSQMVADFGYIYCVRINSIERIKDYADFKVKIPEGYCMLVLSKEPV